MRLGIDDILTAHGIGGGAPSPSFGTGADGDFSPVGGAGHQTSTINFGSAQTVYYRAGTQWPGTGGSVFVSNAFIMCGIYADKINGYTFEQGTSYAGVAGSVTAYSITSTSCTYGSPFTLSNSIEVTKFGMYIGVTGYNVTLYLWDNVGNVVASGSVTSNGGFVYFALSTPVTLAAGTYWIGFYTTIAISFGTLAQSTPFQATFQGDNYATTTFDSTADGTPVVKNFSSINIPKYSKVTVSNRCQGLIMLCTGDVTINGEVSMDYLGAILDPASQSGFFAIEKAVQLHLPSSSKNKVVVIGPGGAGGAGGNAGQCGQTNSSPPIAYGGKGTNGTWWGGGIGGGGAGGQVWSSTTVMGSGGNGGDAAYTTNSTGGSGASASCQYVSGLMSGAGSAFAGINGGGGGGAAYVSTGGGSGFTVTSAPGGKSLGGGGGGAGSAAYSNTNAAATNTGFDSTQAPGGLVFILCKGNLTIGSSGVVSCKGGAGGSGGNAMLNNSSTGTMNATGGGGGGGAGGGIIAMLYKGTLSNSGTTNVAGGPGGLSGTSLNGASNTYVANSSNGKNGNNGQVQFVQL